MSTSADTPTMTVRPSMSDREIVVDVAYGKQEILTFAVPLQAGQTVYDGCHAIKESIELALEMAYQLGHDAGFVAGKTAATTLPAPRGSSL